jgi:hypothetical protein
MRRIDGQHGILSAARLAHQNVGIAQHAGAGRQAEVDDLGGQHVAPGGQQRDSHSGGTTTAHQRAPAAADWASTPGAPVTQRAPDHPAQHHHVRR